MENGIKFDMVLSKVSHVRQTSSFFDNIRNTLKKDSTVVLMHLYLSKTFETMFMEMII